MTLSIDDSKVLAYLIKYEDTTYDSYEISEALKENKYNVEEILEKYENEIVSVDSKDRYILVRIAGFGESSRTMDNFWKMVLLKKRTNAVLHSSYLDNVPKSFSIW